ncbi:hypothetical protein JCM10207_006103 [Rhodosporidiobolus poonsookiae]
MPFAPGPKYPDFLPLEREFIGYGLNTPDPKWPGNAQGNAKICLSFVIEYYSGAERTLDNGDEGGETALPDIPIRVQPKGKRFDMLESVYEYGSREGFPRLLRLLDDYKMKATFAVSSQALEKTPYYAKALAASPHEIACASKRYIDYLHVSPEEEEQHISEAIETLQSLTGDKTLPHTWMVGRPSNISTLLYARAHHERKLPLLASSDDISDELPFWRPSPLAADGLPDEGLLMIPADNSTGDHRFVAPGSGWASPRHYFEYLKDNFDQLYEEGEAGEPKMMSVTLHPHVIGHGGRIFWLEEFLKHVQSKGEGNVWVARRDEIAEHWKKTHPYDPATAFGQTKQVECW